MESKENPRPKFVNENPWYTEKKLPQYTTWDPIQERSKKPIQLILHWVKKAFFLMSIIEMSLNQTFLWTKSYMKDMLETNVTLRTRMHWDPNPFQY